MSNKKLQTIGNRIKISREKLGLSQSDLSRAMHLSRTMCGQWERGVANPSTLHLSKLADILGVSFEYLAKGVQTDNEIKFSLSKVDKNTQEKVLESKMVSLFRKLTLRQKEDLIRLLESLND